MCNKIVLCRGLEEGERRGGREGEVRLEVVGEGEAAGDGRCGEGSGDEGGMNEWISYVAITLYNRLPSRSM